MEERCIFCAAELGRFDKKKLSCGNTTQILCKDCYARYRTLSAPERAEAALRSGRAEDEESLRSYLADIYRHEQKEEEQRRESRERRATELKCLRCGARMLNHGPVTFKLGEETYFFSDLNRLVTGSVTMEALRCEACGKVEFFAVDGEEFERASGG